METEEDSYDTKFPNGELFVRICFNYLKEKMGGF